MLQFVPNAIWVADRYLYIPAIGIFVLFARMIERAAAARDADLDSLFVGDHHSTGPGAYYQNVPIMGRLLAEWSDRPAGVLFLLPLWNPVLVAEQIGTLASIHAGRFILQCAIGRDDEPLGGCLFEVSPGVRGAPTYAFAG